MTGPQATKASDDSSGPQAVLRLPAIDLDGARGMSPAAQRRHWRRSLAAAGLVHCLALYALWPDAAPFESVGMGDAIAVDIVSSAMLDAQRHPIRTGGTGAEVPIWGAAGAGSAAASTPESPAVDDRRSGSAADRTAPRADIVAVEEPVEEPPDPDAIAIAPEKDAQARTGEMDRPPEPGDRPEPPSPASQSSAAAEHAAAGGMAVPGLAASGGVTAGGGQASRPGAAEQYRRTVIETLAARKPKAIAGVRGEVLIEFTIAGSGEVANARVANSSGRRALDEAALEAVLATRFSSPPPGLTRLTYRIPYYFR